MSAPATSEARRRLSVVDGLLAGTDQPAVGHRASVWLLRLALEHALAELWAARSPEVAAAAMRAQLLVLPRYLDADRAWRVSELWYVLSRVAHHHAYELVPTRAEIVTWRRDTEFCVAALEAFRLAGGATA